jgi:hypothetical protein
VFVVQLLQALLTPAIGLLAAFIAWQQWETNREKLRLDKYDRRMRVYEELRKILSIVFRDDGATTDDLLRFRTSVADADFLFGQEIPEYLDQIYTHGLKLWELNEQHRNREDRPVDYDLKKAAKEKHSELKWLANQFEIGREKFRKYLNLSR